MKKKYFILALTFLCLLMGQSSFGQNVNSDYDEDDICTNETTYFDYSEDCLDVYINVVESYYCIGGVHIDTYSYPSYVSKECDSLNPCDISSSAYNPCICDPLSCDSMNPCDILSSAYNPCICDPLSCDSMNPCDISSSAYNPCICDPSSCQQSCNESSTPKPSGYIASQYHFVQNSDTDCQWVPYCDPTQYWYESGICMKKYTLNGLILRDHYGRTAQTGQMLYVLSNDKSISASAITSISATNNTADFGGLTWNDGYGANIPNRDITPSSSQTFTVTGGMPTSTSKSTMVKVVDKYDSNTPNFYPPGINGAIGTINAINNLPIDVGFSFSRSKYNKLDFNANNIVRDYTVTSGKLSISAGVDILVYGINASAFSAGLFVTATGELDFIGTITKYKINAAGSDITDDAATDFSLEGSLSIGPKLKLQASAGEVFSFTASVTGTVGIVGSATANNNQVTGNLSAGKLTVLYDINAEVSGFDLVHIDDDYTVWDGLKIYENEVLFTY